MKQVLTAFHLHYRWFWGVCGVDHLVLADRAKLIWDTRELMLTSWTINRKDIDMHLYDIFESFLFDYLSADHCATVVYCWRLATQRSFWVRDGSLLLCLDLFLVVHVEGNNFDIIKIIIALARQLWWTIMTRYGVPWRIWSSTETQSLIPLLTSCLARLLNPRAKWSSYVFLLTQTVVSGGGYHEW